MPSDPAAHAAPIAPGAGAPDHVLAAMRAQVATIRVREPGVRTGADPEDLHQMRTGVRRLRAILRAVGPMFETEEVQELRRELRWLGGALGAARDADVFRAYVEGELGAVPDALTTRLDAERAAGRVRALAALDDPRYPRLMERLEEVIRRARLTARNVSLPALAASEFKRLRKAADALPKKPGDRELHAVRIKVKRARYTAELAELEVGRRAERFATRAHKVQNVLGEHQDAVVAEERLRALVAEGGQGAAVARRLLERQPKRRKAALAAFRDEWPKLERRGVKAWT